MALLNKHSNTQMFVGIGSMGGRSKMPPGGRSSGIFHDDAPSTSSPSSRSGSAHQRTVRGPSSAAHSHAGAAGGVFPNDVAMLNRPAPQAQASHRGQGGSGGYGNVFQNDNQMAQRSTPQGGQQRQQQANASYGNVFQNDVQLERSGGSSHIEYQPNGIDSAPWKANSSRTSTPSGSAHARRRVDNTQMGGLMRLDQASPSAQDPDEMAARLEQLELKLQKKEELEKEVFLREREEKRRAAIGRTERSNAAPFVATDGGTGENLLGLLARNTETQAGEHGATEQADTLRTGKKQKDRKKVVRGPPRCAAKTKTRATATKSKPTSGRSRNNENSNPFAEPRRAGPRGAPSCAATMPNQGPSAREKAEAEKAKKMALGSGGFGNGKTANPAAQRALQARRDASNSARNRAARVAAKKQKALTGGAAMIGRGKHKIADGRTSSKVLAPPGGKSNINFIG